MTPDETSSASLDDVRALASRAHEGQLDPDRSPHILHCERVAEAVESHEEKMAALLHDVLEDSNLSAEDLRREGVPEIVVEAVSILTKSEDDAYTAYIERVASAPGVAGDLARRIKVADLRDNLARSVAAGLPEKVDRYRQALRYLTGGAPI